MLEIDNVKITIKTTLGESSPEITLSSISTIGL
jgi:hypothetical protein